ncbi:MAG: MATE family efflux transporter [Oscillospiraceae bacterium]|nr:MATE family efflux transporter [Oscillospiraceae bacterium]
MNQDLTQGEPRIIIRNFCLPLLGSILFQQLYNIADSLVAGKFVGENALAAVGNSYEVTLIFIAFAFGCNIGCSVIISLLFGAKEYRDMKTAVSTTFIASGVLCAVLMVLGLTQCTALLRLIQTPAEVLADSALYLNIYILGLPFLFYYNISTGIFSAMGDSKTPFLFLAFSSTANVAVDIFFVKAFNMGVAGVAWATFLCQGISCALSVIAVFRRLAACKTQEKPALFSWSLLMRITKIAIPSTLQQSFVSVGNIIIQGIINGFGPSVMAGYAAAIKLNNLVITSFTTLGNGVSNYTAQNLGANKPERIRAGFVEAWKLLLIIALPVALLYFFGAQPLLSLFMEDPTGPAMDSGIQILHILAPFYLLVCAKMPADGTLRGLGQMGLFMVSTFVDLILRVVLALILSSLMGSALGIWLSWPIGWLVGTALSFLFYRKSVPAKS